MVTSVPICTYILQDKNRRCKLPAKQGALFCGAHSTHSTVQPCRHCGTALPHPSAIDRHTRRCPVLKRQAAMHAQPWHVPNCNMPFSPTSPESSPITQYAPSDQISALVSHILRNHIHRSPAPSWVPCHPSDAPPLPEASIIESTWSDPRISTVKMERKHFDQIASLSTALFHQTPSQPHTAIIELGAGRAYTSMYLAHVQHLRAHKTSIVVVDQSSTRNKADRSIRHWVQDDSSSIVSFRRLTCDVSDVDLTVLEECEAPLVYIVGKHVCGGALDISLHAATRLARSRAPGSIGLVFAVCCRRLCSWQTLGCREVLSEWGIDEQSFYTLRKIAAWGLDEAHDDEMAELGNKCRLVIDWARVVWLRRLGWDAHLGTYTSASPEHTCIAAVFKHKQGIV